jgi:hypothetical protein
MTYLDLHRKLHENRFKPFRIRMVNGTVYDVREPWMVLVGRSSAIVVTQTQAEKGAEIAEDWRTVSIAHMIEFSDLATRSNGSKRKK